MSLEWETVGLGDATVRIGMGPFGSSIKVETFVDTGVPVISGQHLHGFRLVDTDFNFVTPEHATRLKAANVARGDVILTHAGNIGQVAWIPNDSAFERYVISQRQFFVRCRREILLPEFLTYYFHSPGGRHQLLANATQTGVPSIAQPVSYVRSLNIRLPPVSEQRRIIGVLAALGDKIEHNRGLCRRLTALAQTAADVLFARARNDGWSIAPIGDLVTVYGGATPSTSVPAYWNGETAFATPKDLAGLEFPILLTTARRITQAGVEKISSGELPPGTVLLSSRAPIGYLAIAEVPVAVNQGFIAMVCNKGLPNHFVLQWLRRSHDEIVGAANGTTFLEISKRSFRPLGVPVPPDRELESFVALVDPLHRRSVAAIYESARLTALRGGLLPKLVSGQIRVPDSYDPTDVLGTVAETAGIAV